MTACISGPDVVSSALAFLNSATFVESAGISVVSMWTGIMCFWCLSCLVIGNGETLESASAMTFSFPLSIQYSHHTVTSKEIVSEEVVSWMLLFSSLCWLETGGQFTPSLCSHRHSEEVLQVQIQHSGVSFLNVGIVLFSLYQTSWCIDN